MTIRPCNEFIDCECSDNPFINTSAEAPDPNLFFARKYYANNPSLNENDSWYERSSCLGTCFSEVSQQDAEDCALRNAQLCTWDPVRPELTLLSDDPPSTPRSNIFGNAAVSCSSPCPTGPDFTFTVPANTFYALTQQEADAIAQSICDYRALVFRMCSGVPPEPPICDVTITSVMPPTFTQDAEVGDSVAMGVTFNYTGTESAVFLWYKDGVPYVTTQNPSLTLDDVQTFDAGVYQLHILIPHCPPVLSPNLTLNVLSCSQTGSPIPDPLFDIDQTPQDLGSFVTPPNTSVPVGSFPPGSFEITYEEGAYGHTLGTNPCPLDPFAYHQGFNSFVAVGFQITQLLGWFGQTCAATTGAITTQIMGGGGPLNETVDHEGGSASFVSSGQDGVPGAPNPTWHVVYTPSPPPDTAQFQIEDVAEILPKLAHPDWTDSPLIPVWDGKFAGTGADLIAPDQIVRYGISASSACSDAKRLGNKKTAETLVEGPRTGQEIADTIDGTGDPDTAGLGAALLASGMLVATDKYWWFQAWDCCHGAGGVECVPHFYGWLGVKEYGADIDGNYRKIYGPHPESPDCITITEL